jgi:hypothetical protein
MSDVVDTPAQLRVQVLEGYTQLVTALEQVSSGLLNQKNLYL